ncbi:gamma-glutamylcyclotransferase, partial [Gleimia europaea]|nr:gamma-glutamylcyclotransferase [Gleimia europaea]
MRGLELHDNLAGAEFKEEIATAPNYRLHTIDDIHPGMYKVASGGVAVDGELYELSPEILLRVIEGEPAGLYRGPVTLADGRVVPGILYSEEMAIKHPDISKHGGWKKYIASKKA